jgi:hypothetical protein
MQHLTLQTLSDRALISDQLYRYAKGLDTRDWDLVASARGNARCRSQLVSPGVHRNGA